MPFLIEWEGGDAARLAEIERIGALAPHPAGWEHLLSVSVLVADPEFAAQVLPAGLRLARASRTDSPAGASCSTSPGCVWS